MAKRKKITKQQAEKVAKMRAFLETGSLDQPKSITIKSEATHITCIRGAFHNATGFYITGGGSTGDRLTFAEIHKVYTAALKDKGFSAYVTSSKGPVKDKAALNGKETAQDDKGGE